MEWVEIHPQGGNRNTAAQLCLSPDKNVHAPCWLIKKELLLAELPLISTI